jgi:REP element-mobilizing transposase RayT
MKKYMSTVVCVALLLNYACVNAEESVGQRITYMMGKGAVYSVDVTDLWEVTLKGDRITGISKDGLVWFTTGLLEGANSLEDALPQINYLSWIQEYSDKYSFSLLDYSLMNNHVHYIGIPHKDDSLARTFNTAHMRYAQYFNKKNKRSGHLWQGRFFSCILDETYLIAAARYIERNPVRADLVTKPWEWKWSSAQAHTKMGNLYLD